MHLVPPPKKERGDTQETTPVSPPIFQASLSDRLNRYGIVKKAQLEVSLAMADSKNPQIKRLAVKVHDCGMYLKFREYLTSGDIRLSKAFFCKKHTLCQFCAIRRSARFLGVLLPKVEHILASEKKLYVHFIVLTVKNTADLAPGVRHIQSSFRTLKKRAGLPKKYPNTMLSGMVAAVTSLEVTETGNLWHPHLNLLVISRKPSFDWAACKSEWLEVTGDSSVIHFSTDSHTLESTLAECIKYVTKFSDLVPEQLFQMHLALNRKRTISTHGLLYGLKLPTDLADELLPEEVPYIEYFCKYIGFGKYDVISRREFRGIENGN